MTARFPPGKEVPRLAVIELADVSRNGGESAKPRLISDRKKTTNITNTKEHRNKVNEN